MKKVLSILLAILIAMSVAACSIPEESSTGTNGTTEPPVIYDPKEFKQEATIAETVLLDKDGIRITATDLVYGSYAAELHLTFENNTGKDLTFVSNSIGYSCNSVNGYMVADGYINCDVAAGKKANESASFSYRSLMIYGIYEIADIEIGFSISDDDYNYTYTGPCRIATSGATNYDYQAPHYREVIAGKTNQQQYDYSVPYFGTDVIYENKGISIVSQTLIKNVDDEYSLLMEVINNTDQMVRAITSDIRLNGLLVCDSTWSNDSINPGKTAIVDINVSAALEPSFWEALGIEEVGTIGLTMEFKDFDGRNIASATKLKVEVSNQSNEFSSSGVQIHNNKGLRLISMGLHEDPSSYSGDLHLLILAENTSGKTLELHDVYGSLSINDYMANYSFYTTTIENGQWVLVDIRLYESGLQDAGVTSVEQIKTLEFSISVKNESYKEIDKATIEIKFP